MDKITNKLKKLNNQFFIGNNVLNIARQLLGKIIVTNINGSYSSGRIVETEAYIGITDKALHSYKGKRIKRSETMYEIGRIVYVNICYGTPHLFNVVANKKDEKDAVLKGNKPFKCIDVMLRAISGKSS